VKIRSAVVRRNESILHEEEWCNENGKMGFWRRIRSVQIARNDGIGVIWNASPASLVATFSWCHTLKPHGLSANLEVKNKSPWLPQTTLLFYPLAFWWRIVVVNDNSDDARGEMIVLIHSAGALPEWSIEHRSFFWQRDCRWHKRRLFVMSSRERYGNTGMFGRRAADNHNASTPCRWNRYAKKNPVVPTGSIRALE
jgi:hypothetical protein